MDRRRAILSSLTDLPHPVMVRIPSHTFRMESDRHSPEEEAPAHRITVDGFWIDRAPVANRQFRPFVELTGRVTVAERPPDSKDYPGVLPRMPWAGSLMFTPRAIRSICGTGANGGPFGSVQPGGRPPGWAPRSRGSTITRWCTSPMSTPRPTPRGSARACRLKRNGTLPPAAGSMMPSSPGATSSNQTGGR